MKIKCLNQGYNTASLVSFDPATLRFYQLSILPIELTVLLMDIGICIFNLSYILYCPSAELPLPLGAWEGLRCFIVTFPGPELFRLLLGPPGFN